MLLKSSPPAPLAILDAWNRRMSYPEIWHIWTFGRATVVVTSYVRRPRHPRPSNLGDRSNVRPRAPSGGTSSEGTNTVPQVVLEPFTCVQLVVIKRLALQLGMCPPGYGTSVV
jgi:hypothetical protein